MSMVAVLILIAGLSESAGRVLPLVARRPGMSKPVVAGLLLTGGLVEATVITLWPRFARSVAELLADGGGSFAWTPGLVAPLVLAGVLAFPWLGPLLHFALLTAVGATLAGPLAAATGVNWWAAAGILALTAVLLALAVDIVRRLVAKGLSIGVVEQTA
ncbi:hypothetical protein [Kribbella sandramycini]|nr:hypothetical protein [Kribbella sandramycini]MBB6569766.1 hypothetical protein [Kribbella sandramycini]